MTDARSDWEGAGSVLLRASWFVVVASLLAGAAAVGLSLLGTPSERATARVVVAPNDGLDANYSLSDTVRMLTQPGIIGTLAEVIEGPGAVQQAADVAGIAAADLEDYTITAEEVPGSTVLDVHVDGADGELTALLADAVIADATALFTELYPLYEVRTLHAATAATAPEPSSLQLAAAGALVGGGLAVLLLLGWPRLRAMFERRPGSPRGGEPTDLTRRSQAQAYPEPTNPFLAGRP